MKNTIQLSIIAGTLLTQLHASELTLEPIEITSTAIKTDELKSPSAVEVYTQKDIQKAHVQNVYEFLNKNTSVFTTSAYGNPFLQKLDMRGYGVGDGYQNIVITINGRKMNNVDMVPQLLASISPSTVEKIEIIKSSGIVVGGDGANAGVINITTRASNDKEISAYLGNYGLADGSFYVGHSDETLAINVSGEAQKNDGIRTIDSAGNKDANKFSTFALNLAYNPLEALELRIGAMTTNTDVIYAGSMTKTEYEENPKQQGTVDYGYGASPSTPTHQTYKSNVLTAGVTYDIDDALSLTLDLSNEKKESNYITYASVTDYHYKTLTASVDYTNDLLAIKAGVDGFDGALERPGLNLSKVNQAAFLMTQFYLSDFTIKAGYRYEKVKFDQEGGVSEDDALNGIEAGLNYLINKNSSLFVDYSHSYQTASLDRMFSFFSGTFTGYVEPSKANNYSIGYSNIQENNKFKISLYYIDLKNEIYYYADPTYVNSKNTNIDKSHKYGLDIFEQYIFSKEFNIALNYNYVQAIIDEESENGEDYSGNKLPGVSDHNAKATINYLPNENTTLALTQLYRSDAYAANDFGNNFTQKQEAYYSTDISATYATAKWEVYAKVNNLFNQANGLWIRDDAIYPVNFTTTGFVGLKLKF